MHKVKPKEASVTKKKGIKEKALSAASGLSGLMGIFSSWTVCHNVCTAAIALLAVIGVVVTGMPLLFLQKVAVPFWTAAVIIFSVLLFLKLRKMGCLSGKMLALNAGLIVMGTPFAGLQRFSAVFYVVGGAITMTAVVMLVRAKLGKK